MDNHSNNSSLVVVSQLGQTFMVALKVFFVCLISCQNSVFISMPLPCLPLPNFHATCLCLPLLQHANSGLRNTNQYFPTNFITVCLEALLTVYYESCTVITISLVYRKWV